ncbi:MAG: putative glycosyltransferase [Mycobacterium sp.]|nr:putative glycosyltransferase [Mycobacterium sp.]
MREPLPPPPAPRVTQPLVDLVLPCLDEREALPWVLGRLPAGWRPIVVDNGSTDGSGDVAAALGATVVREQQRGFGAACWAGLSAATAPIVCFADCDGSVDPADAERVVAPVRTGAADLVLAARRPDPGAWPVHARLANRELARRVRRLTGLPLSDLGPLRAARRTALLELGLTDRRSGWPLEMVLRAAAAGWRVQEVEAPYRPRTGKSKVTGTVRGTVAAVRDMDRVLRVARAAAGHDAPADLAGTSR